MAKRRRGRSAARQRVGEAAPLPPATQETMAMLRDPDLSPSAVAAACDAIVRSMPGTSPEDARVAARTLLPTLASQLTLLQSPSSGAPEATTRTAAAKTCAAMAVLTDHADADVIAAIVASGAMSRLAALLEELGGSKALQPGGAVLVRGTIGEGMSEVRCRCTRVLCIKIVVQSVNRSV